MRRQAGLAGAGGAGDQHAAAAVVALAAEHRVEPRDAGRDALVGHRVVRPSDVIGRTEMPSSSIRNGYSLVPCVRAAVLDDAQAPRGDLLGHAVVEQDHAVGDVLLQPLAGERAVAALAGDDRGDALVLEPAEQPPQLRAQDRLVGEAAEERLDGVEHDALGADRVDGVAQADEQAFEVVLAGLLDLAARSTWT